MQSIPHFSQTTIDNLAYYVYTLVDPRDNAIFYVGKGTGKRIYHHLTGTLQEKEKNLGKMDRIKEIRGDGKEVGLKIIRHGLTEKEAFEIESAVIDVLGIKTLENSVLGHHSDTRGIMTLGEILEIYEPRDAVFTDNMLLINVNKFYDKDKDLYEITRKARRVDYKKVQCIFLVCAIYRGIIKEIYTVENRISSSARIGRYEFIGRIAPENIRQKYIHTSVQSYRPQGAQNPIKYVYI